MPPPASQSPLYEQIKEQIGAAILSGELADGEALPSVRALARDLRISVITTTRAYNELAAEGFITTVPGKGAFVQPLDSELVREQRVRQVEAGLQAGQAHVIKLGPLWPDLVAAGCAILFCASAAIALTLNPRRARRPVAV